MSARRTILAVLPLIALAIAFWVLLLGPKREEASQLETDVSAKQAEVDEQQQLAASAEAARKEFPRAYRRVVVLGKAAPEDEDTSSLLVQLDGIAQSSGVDFMSLEAEQGAESESAPAPAAPQTPAETAEASEQEADSAGEGVTAPAPATEASAALLPIGASIGPAGLPVMKYTLSFEGEFFELADFFAGLDKLVKTTGDGVHVQGRLVTVDGFELSPLDIVGSSPSNPRLAASLTVTTYLTPADEGVTAGASPAGPAPATAPQPAATTAPTGSTTTASTGAP